jgi:phospholipid/cholesterol/gamma-HCH transport system substrate-binding protein
MKDAKLEFAVGLFMLLGLAALAYLTVKLGAGEFVGRDTYRIEARFANTGGLNKGANVMLAGVPVGRVDGIRLDPDDYSAIATLSIRRGVALPADTMASVKTTGLIGDKYIALAPGADDEFLEPTARILMTESAVELESLISKMAFGSVGEAEGAAGAEPGTPGNPAP